MASLLKILTDTPCDVYVDYELRGYAEPCKLLRLELRKGCYILEFKYKNIILESQDYVMPSNDEEALLKLSLADKYAAAQEVKKTLFYIATEKLDTDRLCPKSNIATHYYNEADGTGSITFYESITEIQGLAFEGCTSLISITIPESVTWVGSCAFEGCTSLTSVTIPESVIRIGGYAFSGCDSLTNITIPDSVTAIGDSAFKSCEALTSFYGKYASKDNRCLIVDNALVAFAPANLTSYTIPDSVTSIGWFAFYGCTSLTSVTIPNSVTSIGNCAFHGCTSLTSVTIPDSVTEIGSYAFSGCASLTSIIVSEGNTVYDSRDNCNAIIETATNRLIFGCQLSRIPDSVTSIGEGAFRDCTSLISVTIPNSVTSIGSGAFSGCASLSSFYGKYASKDNRCSIVDNALVAFAPANLTSYTIPDSVTEIAYGAFRGCTSLTSVTIPNSVTSIGNCAFHGCTSLISVTIPNSVTSIGSWAFEDCTSLTSITIPESVTWVGPCAFKDCTSLISVTIPEVVEIADDAFCGCGMNYVRYTRDYEAKGKYLFFDTETTGLPINYNAPTNDLSNWPRMVQLSWMLTDNEGVMISYGNFIIKPLGFVISDSAIKLHGITNEIANQDGVALQEVLAKFVEDVKNASCLVGHNVEFDKHIVGAELLRIGDEDIISFMTSICTMMSSIDYCKIINHYGYKYPKLQELYKSFLTRSLRMLTTHRQMSAQPRDVSLN